MGNTWGQALAGNGLANIALNENRIEDAYHLLSRSLDVFTALGDISQQIHLRHQLGMILLRKGQTAQALEHLRANRDHFSRTGEKTLALRYDRFLARIEVGELDADF
jgi:hypothetical protein